MGWQPYPGNGSSGGINSSAIPDQRAIPFSYIGIQEGVAGLDDSGTVPLIQLPAGLPSIVAPPQISTLGGLFAKIPVSTNFATGVDTSGNITLAQPAATDISGLDPHIASIALPLATGGTVAAPVTVTGNLTSTAKIVGQTGATLGLNTSATTVAQTINAVAGQIRQHDFQTAGVSRFRTGIDNTTESGAGATAWAVNTTYVLNAKVIANGNIYIATTASGTSAATGTGPSGTGTGIVDNNILWNFVAAANSGSAFFINAFSDSGALLGTPFKIPRNSLQGLFAGPVRQNFNPVYNNEVAGFDKGWTFNTQVSGTTTGAGWLGIMNFICNNDTVNITNGASQLIGFQGQQFFGGAGFGGNRSGLRWQLTQNGVAPAHANYQSMLGSITPAFSSGGTDLWSNTGGNAFGGSFYYELNSGATLWRGAVACEMDYGVDQGASAASVGGLNMVRWANHAFAPPIWENDFVYGIGSQGSQASGTLGAKFGFIIGQSSGSWPIDQVNGRIMGSGFPATWFGANPLQAAHGIDFYNLDLVRTQYRGKLFSVIGSGRSKPQGSVQVGGGVLYSSGTTVTLDASGSVCSAIAIHASGGGGNNIVGAALIHDDSGTFAEVSAVDANGVVTAVVLKGGGTVLSVPSNPLSFRVSVAPFNITAANWTASFSGSTMTVTVPPASGAIGIGQSITATGIDPMTVITAGSGPAYTLSIPSGTLTARTVSGGPIPVLVDATWVTSKDIQINSSGGDVIVGKGAAIATTSVAGFGYIPFCAGPPTGVPTNVADGPPMIWDTVNHKLWVYDSGWKGVVFS